LLQRPESALKIYDEYERGSMAATQAIGCDPGHVVSCNLLIGIAPLVLLAVLLGPV